MYALFEEAGKFMAGRILSEAEASAQVELDSGKRVKVKAAQMLLKFEKPSPASLLSEAAALSQTIELELAYEFASDEEFGFADLARDYFSDGASTVQQVAALLRLHEAPHYFRRGGKGRYRKAPAEIVQQALLAIEKKKQVQAQIEAWSAELVAGVCPAPIREQLYKILFRPDKNTPEYKAVVEASKASQTAPLDLLQKAGAIASAWDFHWQRFLFDLFPKGTGFPALQAPAITDELPLAPVQAFSIDDSHTTEIDDALSLQGLGTGTVTVGIHIAAPGLALTPGSPIDQLGRQRLSTVYMPGYKITMLPDSVVQTYTLTEGRDCPAVSLYVTFSEDTLEVQSTETRLERVPILVNLRHDQLDDRITREWLEGEDQSDHTDVPVSRATLGFFWRLAQTLKARREVVRGKPESFNRPDYSFKLDRPHNDTPPTGEETVLIGTRKRGAPLDLMVAEAMIWPTAPGVSGWPSWACLAFTAARPAWPPASRCAWAPRRCPMRASAFPAMPGAPRPCAATPIWSTSGRSLRAPSTAPRPHWPRPSSPKTPSCFPSSAVSMRPTAPTTACSPAWNVTGRCAMCSSKASTNSKPVWSRKWAVAPGWCGPTPCP